ncbi:MAG: creatininase family protein [Burkholderiales bacterium]|nr:creatininase family protein [Opitutaceae bacterium]
MPFPAYRDRYLPAFTAAQIAALPDKASIPVIVPTGAIEQHGPHLPVAVDSFLGQVWVERVCAALPADFPLLVAPPITVGKSNEHVGFPGTLAISKHTLRLQLLAIAAQLKEWGFRRMLILNTHGGNSAVLVYTMREIEHRMGMSAGYLRNQAKIELPLLERTYGFHANTVETALLYATAPAFTRPEAAPRHYPGSLEDPGELRPEFAPATYSWASQDISPHGVMGDATVATAEDGARWIDAIVDGFVAELTGPASTS